MFKQQLLIVIAFMAISLACTSKAKAQHFRKVIETINGTRQERAVYNAHLLAYKIRYSQALTARNQSLYRQALGYQSPIHYYASPPGRYYYRPTGYVYRAHHSY